MNGFSLYELLIYPQNRKWAEGQGLTDGRHLPNYFMFQAGAGVLKAQGFKKNLFNHWVDEQDRNLYFTFPQRDEDCLAIGAIGDGVFGDYHYRHPRYASYLRLARSGLPGLEGGLRRTSHESELRPITTAVLSNHIPNSLLTALQKSINGQMPLLERWQNLALIEPAPDGGFWLTTNGAWFAGNMIKELTGQYPEHTYQA